MGMKGGLFNPFFQGGVYDWWISSGGSTVTANQILFSSSVVSPLTDGVVPDSSGNSLNGRLKNAPCLTSSGTTVLNFADLTGVTVVSSGGTAVVGKSGNTLTIGSGTVYNIVLSNGKIIPCHEGAGTLIHSSDGLWRATITNASWTTQDEYFYSYANSVSRLMQMNDAIVTRLSYKSAILTDADQKKVGITQNMLQDFVVKFNFIVTTGNQPQLKGVFCNNYTASTNQNAGWYVALSGNSTELVFSKATNVTTVQTVTSSTFTAKNDGLKHEGAVVKNGTALSFYIDGALVNTATLTSATINYSTGSSDGLDTCIGAINAGAFYQEHFRVGYIWNVQLGAYSAGHVTNVTSQADLGTPLSRWRLTAKTLKKNVSVYDDDVAGYYLVPFASAATTEPFLVYGAGSTYGYPKGRFWKDLGYTLDLTNRGANTSLSGKESALAVATVRNHAGGDFKYYDNYEGTNIRTYLTVPSAAQLKVIDAEIGYLPSDGVIIIDERGQSNMQAFNTAEADPAADYLAVQNAKIFADIGLTGSGTWQALQAKVNCEGIVDTNSVAMNVAIAKTSESDLGNDRIRFIKYAVGNTAVFNEPGDDWSPDSVGELVTKSNAFATQAINALIAEGVPASKISLGAISWFQGEADLRGTNPGAYYTADVLEDIESFLDNYIALGVDTSNCIVQVFTIYLPDYSADPNRSPVRAASMRVGINGMKLRPTLVGKCLDTVFIDTDSYTLSADNVHVSKTGQVNLGIYSYNNILKDAFRRIRPF